jgi:hypothetical protein
MKNAVLCLLLAACGPLPVDEDVETVEDEVATSIFRNNLRRVNLQPQALGQAVIDVSTEDEFRAALTSLPAITGNCYGRGIRVVVPEFVIRDGFTLGPQHAGISLSSATTTIIVVSGTLSTPAIFDLVQSQATGLGADDVSITGFRWSSTDTLVNHEASRLFLSQCGRVIGSATLFGGILLSTLVGSSEATVSACSSTEMLSSAGVSAFASLRVINSSFTNSSVANVNESSFIGNNFVAVTFTGSKNQFIGNRFTGALTVVGELNSATGNYMSNNSITMSSSLGYNSIVGNTGCSAVTADEDGTVGLNSGFPP